MSLLLDWRGREIKYFGLEGRRGQSKIEERRRVQCKEGKGEKCRGEEGSKKNADHKRIENVLLVFYLSTVWPCLLCVGLIFHYVCFFFQFFSYSICFFWDFLSIFFLLVWFVGVNQKCHLCRDQRTFG